MITINKIENLLNFIFIFKSLDINSEDLFKSYTSKSNKKLEVNLSYIEEKYDKLIGNIDKSNQKIDSIILFLSQVKIDNLIEIINCFENNCSNLSDIKEEIYTHVHPKIVEYTKNYIRHNQREINLLLLI